MRDALRLARGGCRLRGGTGGDGSGTLRQGEQGSGDAAAKIRYRGPFYVLLGRLHIDSAIDSPIANVQRSLGLADEHDVD
jgi:hypothetical protein